MLRRAEPDDAVAIASLFQESRAEAMPWLPVLHTHEETIEHFSHRVVEQEVWVAEADGRVAAFATFHNGWLNDLYVAPWAQRRGLGDGLFAMAKERMPEGFRWHVFQWNERARRFYDARGGVMLELNDAGGEEQLPDALYEWRPAQ